jgi:hypothetical protein
MVSPAVSAEGRSTSLRPESRGRLRYKWSDIISTIAAYCGEKVSPLRAEFTPRYSRGAPVETTGSRYRLSPYPLGREVG